MITCTSCRHPNLESLPYCHHCGKPLKASFDQVQQSLRNEAHGERQSSTAHELNRWLFLLVFFILANLFLSLLLPVDDWETARPLPSTLSELLPPPLPVIPVAPVGYQQFNLPRQGDHH